MKNIKKDRKGNIVIIGLIIVLAIIIAMVFFMQESASSDYWETDWKETPSGGDDGTGGIISSGEWGQEIILVFEDGSLQSLKPVYDDKALATVIQNEEIVGIYYLLRCKITGEGADSVAVDVYDYKYSVTHTKISGERVGESGGVWVYGNRDISPTKVDIPVDGAWHTVIKHYHEKWDLVFKDYNTNTELVGRYTVSIKAGGTLKYSIDGGEWITGTLPDTITITVDATEDTNPEPSPDPEPSPPVDIVVSFDSGYVKVPA